MDEYSEDSTANQKKIKTALERFKLVEEAESAGRQLALEDIEFRKGDQWPDDIAAARKINGRPCLTINKMPQFVRQVTNDQKQNRPAIKVSPVDDYADKDTAKVLQGLIRNIENQSDAEEAYDKAFQSAAEGGFGYFRIYTDYVDAESFDLEARIGMISNPFNVFLDPYHQKLDGSDAEWGFIVENHSKDEFLRNYPESKLTKDDEWDANVEMHRQWIGEDEIRVAEYFYKEYEKTTICKMSDGRVVDKSELPEPNEDDLYLIDGILMEILDERKTTKCKVKWCKLTCSEVLEETEWVSKYIPIIPVYGEVLNIDGHIVRESIIRHAKDSQRMVNFWASAEAESISLAPKAPFIGAEGQFEGHEQEWANSNVENMPYLEYKPTTLDDGTPVPPPSRNAFEPPVMAITQARQLANEDVKETTGVPDAARGLASPETSGIAIQRRVNQGLTSNFHLVDNLSKSIKHAGRILVEIIPKIYDTPRAVRILGEQDEERIVRINDTLELPEGQKRPYDFSYGKYDVSVSTGPSYETKRQEARDNLLQMMQFNPQFAQVAGDLLVKNFDFPGAEELAERIKKTIPPDLLSDENDEIPPAVQAQLKQSGQMIEQLTAQIQQLQQTIDNDMLKIQSDEKRDLAKIQSEEKMELAKINADIQKEMLKAENKAGEEMLRAELKQLEAELKELGYGTRPRSQSAEPV